MGKGNGSEIIISHHTWRGIHEHVEHARLKHPWHSATNCYRLRVLLSEVRELIWAVVWERDAARIRDEAFDCVAVLVRWVEGDGDV
jgi:hypothetical protein